MALINEIEHQELERDAPHRAVRCTYSIITDADGSRLLQLDTYGSTQRQIPNKKSQSLRFSKDALAQLAKLIQGNGLLP